MSTCFVIQPFDNDKYDHRYDDLFAPAIRAADLEPYRVDRDPGVNDMLTAIKTGIDNCSAYFADITEDNPNVWYEFGYATRSMKPYCVCCSSERTVFPFDVSHMKLIRYDTGAPRDYEALFKKITERLKAVVTEDVQIESLRSSAQSISKPEGGLSSHERVALALLFETQLDEGGMTGWSLNQSMAKAGFTKVASNLAVVELMEKRLVSRTSKYDEDRGTPYDVYFVTDEGTEWLRNHKDQLVLRKDEDIPF